MAPMLTTVEEANGILTMLRRSKATCDLAARLDDHSGPTSRLSAEAIVLATCLAAWKLASCTRADVCAVLNGLDAQVAYQLGLCDHDRWEPVSYSTVDKQARRLETALSEGWANADGEQRDLAWFTRVVLAETVPAGRRSAITAVAIDSTFVEAWAVTRDFRREVDAQAEHCQAARNSLELPPPATCDTTASGDERRFGRDGRLVRSADPDARPGHRTATNKQPARTGLGYDAHLVVAVPGARWTGDPDYLKLTAPTPAYILDVEVAPAATDPGQIGLKAIAQARQVAPHITEVVADRGYTPKRESFMRPLHAQGIDVVMDYMETQRTTPTVVLAGRKQQTLLLHCGTLLPSWLPESLHAPPADLTGAELTDWYRSRAKWRWTKHQRVRPGRVQFRCPQCAGRIRTNARTRSPRPTARTRPTPRAATISSEFCCDGLATLTLAQLDSVQRIPYGTPAWQKAYARRNHVESVNARLKDRGGLKPGWCRAFGATAHALGTIALAIVHNISLALNERTVDSMTTEQPHQQRRRTPATDANAPADEHSGPTEQQAPP